MQTPLQITIRDIEHCDGFDATKRKVEDHARKIRGDVKTHEPRRMNDRDEVDADAGQ